MDHRLALFSVLLLALTVLVIAVLAARVSAAK